MSSVYSIPFWLVCLTVQEQTNTPPYTNEDITLWVTRSLKFFCEPEHDQLHYPNIFIKCFWPEHLCLNHADKQHSLSTSGIQIIFVSIIYKSLLLLLISLCTHANILVCYTCYAIPAHFNWDFESSLFTFGMCIVWACISNQIWSSGIPNSSYTCLTGFHEDARPLWRSCKRVRNLFNTFWMNKWIFVQRHCVS